MTNKLSDSLIEAIDRLSHESNIPSQLVRAIVLTESNGSIYAYRVEPPYRYLFNIKTEVPFRSLTPAEVRSERAPADFPHYTFSSRDTEWWGQQASWGPMQIMGAVARECGFEREFTRLCSASTGIQYGIRHLAKLIHRFHTHFGYRGVAAAYNAGSPRHTTDGKFVNQEYVDRIARNGGFIGLEMPK